jgi:leader peptidase (prepilin peptidase) / N-methyltransferase
MATAVVFLFGLAIGSFLNVCIHRLPLDMSLVRPRSRCPACKTAIAFYDNIPVISYLILRGRCRHCGARISFRYPLVELTAGLFAVALFLRYGVAWETVFLYAFVASLLVVTFIDLDHRIIPNVITYPGVVIGFLGALFLNHLTYQDSLLGIFAGAGILVLVAGGYYLLTKRIGMGGGDVKLLAMVGAFLGWPAVFFTVLVGSATGAFAGIAMALLTGKGRRTAIPFGPFLSLGALLYLFEGPRMIEWYFNLLR